MAQCTGQRGTGKCGKPLFRCKSCGHVGCAQATANHCTNQGFLGARCVKCGKYGREPVP